jgi:hypothetical protein
MKVDGGEIVKKNGGIARTRPHALTPKKINQHPAPDPPRPAARRHIPIE